jgi:hypothetical protein
MEKTMKPLDILKQLKLNESIKKRPNVPLYALESALPKYTDKTANGLTRCILDFLELCDYQVERINTMGRPIDNRKQVTDVLGRTKTIGSMTWGKSTATKGSADISATIEGLSVKIEVKIGKDRQSEYQKIYQANIEKAKGKYWIVKNFDDFYEKYQNLLESNKSIT